MNKQMDAIISVVPCLMAWDNNSYKKTGTACIHLISLPKCQSAETHAPIHITPSAGSFHNYNQFPFSCDPCFKDFYVYPGQVFFTYREPCDKMVQMPCRKHYHFVVIGNSSGNTLAMDAYTRLRISINDTVESEQTLLTMDIGTWMKPNYWQVTGATGKHGPHVNAKQTPRQFSSWFSVIYLLILQSIQYLFPGFYGKYWTLLSIFQCNSWSLQ